MRYWHPQICLCTMHLLKQTVPILNWLYSLFKGNYSLFKGWTAAIWFIPDEIQNKDNYFNRGWYFLPSNKVISVLLLSACLQCLLDSHFLWTEFFSCFSLRMGKSRKTSATEWNIQLFHSTMLSHLIFHTFLLTDYFPGFFLCILLRTYLVGDLGKQFISNIRITISRFSIASVIPQHFTNHLCKNRHWRVTTTGIKYGSFITACTKAPN